MRTNFHTHVNRCRHASGTAEDYINCAIQSGLKQLGFSDHAPFPEDCFGLRMPYKELNEYLNELDELKIRYKGKIRLWKGLEIEYLPEFYHYYEKLLVEYKVEYLLLGEHYYKTSRNETKNIYETDFTELYVDYAKTVAQGIRTELFQAVAHPDIFMINPWNWDENCEKATDIILDAAVNYNIPLEYNANGIRRGIWEFPNGKRYPYPYETFWKKAASAGVRVIVGSDCHEPSQVWDESVERSYQNLKKLGIVPETELLK